MSGDLVALAERVEKATGADWSLDEAILLALGYKPYSFYDENDYSEHGWHAPEGGLPISSAPRYTASLDAAMTLKPTWALPNLRHDSDRMQFFCQLENGLGRPFKGYKAHGETYALALCAAVLRALAEQQDDAPARALSPSSSVGEG